MGYILCQTKGEPLVSALLGGWLTDSKELLKGSIPFARMWPAEE